LIAESFNAASGIKAVHVPYKGSVPALTDVAGGQVTYSIETAASTMPFIRNGRLKGYGVSLKDGSTVTPGQEPLAKVANIPGFDLGAWVGVLVPAGTPQPVIDRLSAAIAKIMKLPEVQKQFDTIAVQVDYRNQENFKKYLKSISQEFATVIKTNDIKVE
jgi:tripartite-type tricarboxylate transporter receptor subunit TctC